MAKAGKGRGQQPPLAKGFWGVIGRGAIGLGRSLASTYRAGASRAAMRGALDARHPIMHAARQAGRANGQAAWARTFEAAVSRRPASAPGYMGPRMASAENVGGGWRSDGRLAVAEAKALMRQRAAQRAQGAYDKANPSWFGLATQEANIAGRAAERASIVHGKAAAIDPMRAGARRGAMMYHARNAGLGAAGVGALGYAAFGGRRREDLQRSAPTGDLAKAEGDRRWWQRGEKRWHDRAADVIDAADDAAMIGLAGLGGAGLGARGARSLVPRPRSFAGVVGNAGVLRRAGRLGALAGGLGAAGAVGYGNYRINRAIDDAVFRKAAPAGELAKAIAALPLAKRAALADAVEAGDAGALAAILG